MFFSKVSVQALLITGADLRVIAKNKAAVVAKHLLNPFV